MKQQLQDRRWAAVVAAKLLCDGDTPEECAVCPFNPTCAHRSGMQNDRDSVVDVISIIRGQKRSLTPREMAVVAAKLIMEDEDVSDTDSSPSLPLSTGAQASKRQ